MLEPMDMTECTVRTQNCLVGHMYIRNLEEVDAQGRDKYLVEWYRPEGGTFGRLVMHNPADGAEKLFALAFNAIVERMKRRNKQEKT